MSCLCRYDSTRHFFALRYTFNVPHSANERLTTLNDMQTVIVRCHREPIKTGIQMISRDQPSQHSFLPFTTLQTTTLPHLQQTAALPNQSAKPYMFKVLAYLDRQATASVLAFVVTCTIALGMFDYLTGFEISFAIFYLAPVSLASLALGRNAGLAFSFTSALVWLAANQFAGETFSHPAIAVWNSGTRLGFFLYVALLLAALKDMLEVERTAARTDFLTLAINSRAFENIATTEIERLRRYGRPFTVAYIDVDNFKTVNDTLGHTVGDLLLQTVVSTTVANLRVVDTMARLGGDEFAILLPETDAAAARPAILRLQQALLTMMCQHQWPVTFSIGVVTYTAAPNGTDDLIKIADDVMYGVKKNRKNAIQHAVYGRPNENSLATCMFYDHAPLTEERLRSAAMKISR